MDVPERFELGTLPYELMAGAAAAVEFLASLASGSHAPRRQRLVEAFDEIDRHESALLAGLERALVDRGGVTIHSRATRRTPTLLMSFADCPAATVASHLAELGVNAPAGSFYALEASRRLGLGDEGALRVGLAPYTNQEDVDRLLDGIASSLGEA